MRLKVFPPEVGDALLVIRKTLTANTLAGKLELEQIGWEILAMAIDIAANKTGAMSNSGTIKSVVDVAGASSISIEFGDGVDYTIFHENWPYDQYMEPTTPGTEPHFLKKAVERFGGHEEIQRRLANAVRRVT